MSHSLLSNSLPRFLPFRRYKPLAALAALLMLAGLAPAHAQSFGRTTAGTIASDGLRADFIRGSKFTLTEEGTVTELCAYVDGQGGVSASQSLRLALYRDTNGTPGAKIGESSTQTISSGTTAGWRCLKTPYLVASPGAYWILVHSGGTAGVARYYYDGPANWYGGTDVFTDGAAQNFGPGNTGSGTLSVYAAYSSTAQLTHAGRTTVGAIPSGGLRADYKRGSRFLRSGYGRADALSAYMDGLGGGAGSSQEVTFALHWVDADGLPSILSIFTGKVTIPKGMPPQWITLPLPPYTLNWPPGFPPEADMWFIIHSGSDAGIARYYADGAGNWCGHADVYSDGTDPSFGSCDAGDGTISAFMSFEPGEFGNGALLGNPADPATATPSSGMSANFIRGSKFTVTDERASLGLMYAYLDGLGGGSGSQQVQILVYDNSPGHRLVAQSLVSSVPAGAQPGWTIFQPKEPVHLPPGDYYMMFFTGGNAGVARNYGTSTPNWLGIGASFSAGPPTVLDPPPADATTGTVTLLMYAELVVPVGE